MKKYICDICKKDCDEILFILPQWLHVSGGRGNVILKPKVQIEALEQNMCYECKVAIADLIDKRQQDSKTEFEKMPER